MVFFEAIQALLSLDISFFVGIAIDNIFWIFAFYALIFYFMEGKRTIYFFLLLTVLIFAFIDFESITLIGWSAASFLLIYYITKLAVLAWAENSPSMKNKLVLISEIQFLGLLIIYTFFMK